VRGAISRGDGYDVTRDLADAGFKPVRALAEKDGFRFVEGLKGAATAPSSDRPGAR
jgi:hypothetical protein